MRRGLCRHVESVVRREMSVARVSPASLLATSILTSLRCGSYASAEGLCGSHLYKHELCRCRAFVHRLPPHMMLVMCQHDPVVRRSITTHGDPTRDHVNVVGADDSTIQGWWDLILGCSADSSLAPWSITAKGGIETERMPACSGCFGTSVAHRSGLSSQTFAQRSRFVVLRCTSSPSSPLQFGGRICELSSFAICMATFTAGMDARSNEHRRRQRWVLSALVRRFCTLTALTVHASGNTTNRL